MRATNIFHFNWRKKTMLFAHSAQHQTIDRKIWIAITSALIVVSLLVALNVYLMERYRLSQNKNVVLIFANTLFDIPRMWLLGINPSDHSEVEKLELVVPLPILNANIASTTHHMDNVVIIRVLTIDQSVPPEDRYAQLYSRFLTPDVWSNPGGLQLRQFEQNNPYSGEQIYITPPDGRDFSARCPVEDSTTREHLCVWEVHTQGFNALVSFSSKRLIEWETIVSTVLDTMRDIRKTTVIKQ